MSTAEERYWKTLPLGRGVQLIKADENGLAALAKPASVLSHPNSSADQGRALLTCEYREDGEYFEWEEAGQKQRLWLLNRLDSATSGVIMAAASEELATLIRELFRHRHVHKTYRALVFGAPGAAEQVWRDQLSVQKRGGVIRTSAAGNVPSEAKMEVLRMRAEAPRLALIQLEPKTGRSHQLRVQCAKHRLPIVGDATYGDFKANRAFAKATRHKRLFLHSLETRFDYAFRGRDHVFVARAEQPAEFTDVWSLLT